MIQAIFSGKRPFLDSALNTEAYRWKSWGNMSSPVSSSTDTDTLVKSELCKFILKNTGLDALSSVDEIVMSYIIGVLESLGSGNESEDVFDVIEFTEMMSAYIPAFSTINTSEIHEWMLQLADWLKENSKKNGESHCAFEEVLFRSSKRFDVASKSVSKSNCDTDTKYCQGSHSRRRSYNSSCSCSSSQSEDDDRCINVNITGMNNEVETLIEMFPNLHTMEAKQFLSMAVGDCEQAVQLILQKQEMGQQLTDSLITKNLAKQKMGGSTEKITEDKKLREQILSRYAYIDQDDDAREHKPVIPKTEPKKLIRYRDNKIVSMKGERYSEVKGGDTGETK